MLQQHVLNITIITHCTSCKYVQCDSISYDSVVVYADSVYSVPAS
jgi:hypothetical protein